MRQEPGQRSGASEPLWQAPPSASASQASSLSPHHRSFRRWRSPGERSTPTPDGPSLQRVHESAHDVSIKLGSVTRWSHAARLIGRGDAARRAHAKRGAGKTKRSAAVRAAVRAAHSSRTPMPPPKRRTRCESRCRRLFSAARATRTASWAAPGGAPRPRGVDPAACCARQQTDHVVH
eukprot:4099427-Prymnesium_polylepis.1